MSQRSALIAPICVFGIYGFFMAAGIFQELVFKPKEDDPRFHDKYTYPIFMAFVASVFGSVTPLVLILLQHSFDFGKAFAFLFQTNGLAEQAGKSELRRLNKGMLSDFFLIGCTLTFSSCTSDFALTMISFPTQVLVKSAKMVPIVICGFLLYRKSYPWYDYVGVVLITSSLVLFNLYDPATAKQPGGQASSLAGIGLCLLSLVSDGLTGSRLDHLNKTFVVTSLEQMLFANFFCALLSLPAMLLIEGTAPFTYCANWPEAVWHLVGYSLCLSFGQVFIYTFLARFGALYSGLVSTTRKFFTVLLSYCNPWTIKKDMTWQQAVAIGVFFFALLLQMGCSAREKARTAKAAKTHAGVNNADARKPLVDHAQDCESGRNPREESVPRTVRQ